MTEIVLIIAGSVLCLAWARIRDQRREVNFWHGEFVRWFHHYQRLSMKFFGKPHLQLVHDEIEIGKSWDDVSELEVRNKKEEEDVL